MGPLKQLGLVLAACFLASAAKPLPTRQPPPGAGPDWVDRFPELVRVRDYNHGDLSPTHSLGPFTLAKRFGTRGFDIVCGEDVLRVEFWRPDVVRVQVGWSGNFTDPASGDLVVGQPENDLVVQSSDKGEFVDITVQKAGAVVLRVIKNPLLLSLHQGNVTLWEERASLARNSTSTFQTLSIQEDEYFFGGGMQNGRFSHKGTRIRISADDNWDDGANPNAVPFYMSSAGYGVFRNTWSPGYYDFSTSPIVLGHNESRFDAFFFGVSPRNYRAILEGYTYIVGRPFMPPIYALGLGDSDCYHNDRHNNDTHVVTAIAARYRAEDLPATWILPNDGYGCGFGVGPVDFPSNFSTLDQVSGDLKEKGFHTGLWSSTGLPDFQREVAKSGIRVAKTDVGWIGDGYAYAFEAVRGLAQQMEEYSDGRRFIWTVEGWAGTHRYAVMWAGDDSGSFDYIRWQIPTFVGSGLSAQAHVSGDIDGIFGGSPETYVRDLQFKCFMTVLMTMSGWAANPDKQPWGWGEPYTSINRLYLKLKTRLTPYQYTMSRLAYETGLPPVRAMMLQFPQDDRFYQPAAGQQFMSGPSLLVAPVYQPVSTSPTRDGIFLPEGDWVDFWNGTIYTGPAVLDGYLAPLELLPVFVQAGSIIPMWPEDFTIGDSPPNELTLEVFPSGQSSFSLYEDDGVTRQALENNAYTRTYIACSAPDRAIKVGGNVVLNVSAVVGSFAGMPKERAYTVRVHLPSAPSQVLLGSGEVVPPLQSKSAVKYFPTGWYFDDSAPGGVGGVVIVKTGPHPVSQGFDLVLMGKKMRHTQDSSTIVV